MAAVASAGAAETPGVGASERGAGWSGANGPFPIVSMDTEFLSAAAPPIIARVASCTTEVALTTSGFTSVGSPTFEA